MGFGMAGCLVVIPVSAYRLAPTAAYLIVSWTHGPRKPCEGATFETAYEDTFTPSFTV